jgi:hypothetical protein
LGVLGLGVLGFIGSLTGCSSAGKSWKFLCAARIGLAVALLLPEDIVDGARERFGDMLYEVSKEVSK